MRVNDGRGAAGESSAGFLVRDVWRIFAVEIIVSVLARIFLNSGLIVSDDGQVLILLAGKAILLAYLLWLAGRRTWRPTGLLTLGRPSGWLLALLLYALAFRLIAETNEINECLMARLYAWFDLEFHPLPQKAVVYILSGWLSRPVHLVMLLFTILIGPFSEELAFRGMALDAFRRPGGVVPALLLTSFLFGLFHTDASLLLPLTLLGIVFGLARLLSGSLWCGLAVHSLHNAIALMANAGWLPEF
ncbi:MAG: CPBP family intramembrane metalloprotease [Planctomycetota bacterium]|nr:CPBP family intramembrane metalloprotease [Planctomycetota bacterium]